jgi:hypothetical protein
MLHQKLTAGEQPGTYRVTDLVTDDDLLTIAQALVHIPADHEHQFRFNVNTISGPM